MSSTKWMELLVIVFFAILLFVLYTALCFGLCYLWRWKRSPELEDPDIENNFLTENQSKEVYVETLFFEQNKSSL